MTRPRSPFVFYDGKPCLVVNFSIDNDQPSAPSPQMLQALLRRHGADNILLLRRLSDDEAAAVTEALDDAAVDAWAHVVGPDGEK
jgi:hypothetical protein